MRVLAVLILAGCIATVSGTSSLAKSKDGAEAGAADDRFAVALQAYVSDGFPFAADEDRNAIHVCIMKLFAPVSAEHKALLADSAFFVDEPQRLGEVLEQYPTVAQDIPGCIPAAAAATNRNVQLSDGRMRISIRAGGTGSHPNHAGGVFYDNGELRVAGELIPLPEYARQLIIRVSETGEVTFEVDP